MKWITRSCTLAVCCIVGMGAQAAPAVEKPVVLPDAMLSITVSDFHGFIDEVGGVAANASPMMNGAFIKSMIGMKIGDPSLSGIQRGEGLAIVFLDPTNIFAVVEVTEAQSTNYLNLVKSQGIHAEYADGALLLAKTAEALARGKTASASVRETLLVNSSPTLRVAMQPVVVLERNADAIDSFLQMLPLFMGQGLMQQPGATLESAQGITQLLEGELRVLLSIASQCETAEIVLAPENGSVRIAKTIDPKADTRLATLLNAPALSEETSALHAGLLGDGTILADFHFRNPDACGAFIAGEMDSLIKAMQWEGSEYVGLADFLKKSCSIYSGAGSEVVRLENDGSMKLAYVIGIRDAAQTLDLLRSMSKEMGPFLKFYESFGMPMTMEFKEETGKAGDVSIHQLILKTDLSSMPEEQKKQMQMMGMENMSYDIAIADGYLYCADPGGIPALMKSVAEPASAEMIQARKVYPEGGFCYYDLNIDSYLDFIFASMPEDPSMAMMKQQLGPLLEGVEPITFAGFKSEGRAQWSMHIPGDLIARIGQFGMLMQMQQMQQQGAGQGMPGAAPQPTPTPTPAPAEAPEPSAAEAPQPATAP